MKTVVVTLLFVSGLAAAACSYGESPAGTARATFAVHCYTVGEHALHGQPGIISVAPGWRDFREVDRVVYDPETITVGQMEELLRRAGTYIGTVEVLGAPTGKREERR